MSAALAQSAIFPANGINHSLLRIQNFGSNGARVQHSIVQYKAYHMVKRPVAASASVSTMAVDNDFELSLEELKDILRDTLWGTERGLSADSDTRAEINELITQIEARNPTPQPNEALDVLDGSWKLSYTSNSELVALLALGRLPFVEVGDILQNVDCTSKSVENRIQLSAPFSRTSLAATASFEVRSRKLLQIQFQEGQVATPELLADFELPQSIDLLGNSVDLGPLRSALEPLDGPFRALVTQAGSILSGAPDLKFSIQSPNSASTWLLNTFVDRDLRISRGDGGSVFVMTKEASLMLPAPPMSDDEDVWVPAAEMAVAAETVVVAVETEDAPSVASSPASRAGNGSEYNN